jgi:hypothetical protein
MSTIQQITNFTLDHYQVWITYLSGATSIALIVQWIKKRFKLEDRLTVFKLEARKFIIVLLGVVSTLAALADVVINNSNGNTLLQLLPQAASIWPWLVALAVVIHRFVVSGTWRFFSEWLEDRAGYKAYKQSQKATPLAETIQPTVTFEGQEGQ